MAQAPIRVLLIEDDSDDALMVRQMLNEAAGEAFDVARAGRLSEGLLRLRVERPDVVLLDLGLPDSSGMETLVAVCEAAPDMPVVVLTGAGDLTAGARAARHGAQDFLVKAQVTPEQLAHTLAYAVVRTEARRRGALQRKVLDGLNRQGLLDMDALADVLRVVMAGLDIPMVGLRLRIGEHWTFHVALGFTDELRDRTEHICTVGPDGEVRRDEEGRLVFDCLCGDVLQGALVGGPECCTERGSFWSGRASETLAALGRTGEPGAARVCCTCGGCESVAIIPLRSEEVTIGLLQFADPRPDVISADTVEQLEDIADSIGTALTRQRAEDALRKYTARVESLRSVDEAVLTAQSVQEVAQAALSRLPDLIPCRRASVVEFDLEAGVAQALAVYDADSGATSVNLPVPLTAFGDLDELRANGPRLTADLRAAGPSSALPGALTAGVRSNMTLPLVAEGELIGCLNVGRAEPGGVEDEDREIARELANVLSVALGAARGRQRRQETERELDAVKYQMRVAREIQQTIYPAEAPHVPGFELAGESIPAEAAGGDYYDYIPMPGGYVGIAVGDVAGHGVGAAMVMTATRAYLRGFAAVSVEVPEVLGNLNEALVADTAQNIFCTMLFARLDTRTGEVVYVNAGHPAGYIFSPSGEVRATLASTAMPLGLMPGATFPAAQSVRLEPGELAFFCTDGIMETASGAGSRFGRSHVLEVVRSNLHAPARQIVHEVCRAVQRLCEPELPADDITAVVVRAEAEDTAGR